jgi:hypothetical protein
VGGDGDVEVVDALAPSLEVRLGVPEAQAHVVGPVGSLDGCQQRRQSLLELTPAA